MRAGNFPADVGVAFASGGVNGVEERSAGAVGLFRREVVRGRQRRRRRLAGKGFENGEAEVHKHVRFSEVASHP